MYRILEAQKIWCVIWVIHLAYLWSPSPILSLYYFCFGAHNLPPEGLYRGSIPGHQVRPLQFLHRQKGNVISLCFNILL